MSLIELDKDEEISRLHTVIDAQLFGTRARAVREMQVKLRVFSDCFDCLNQMTLPPEARQVIETCKIDLGMVSNPV